MKCLVHVVISLICFLLTLFMGCLPLLFPCFNRGEGLCKAALHYFFPSLLPSSEGEINWFGFTTPRLGCCPPDQSSSMPFAKETNQRFHICCNHDEGRPGATLLFATTPGRTQCKQTCSRQTSRHIEGNVPVYTQVTHVSDREATQFKDRCECHELQKSRLRSIYSVPDVTAKCMRRHK